MNSNLIQKSIIQRPLIHKRKKTEKLPIGYIYLNKDRIHIKKGKNSLKIPIKTDRVSNHINIYGNT